MTYPSVAVTGLLVLLPPVPAPRGGGCKAAAARRVGVVLTLTMLPTYVGRNVANDATFGGDGVRDRLANAAVPAPNHGMGEADGAVLAAPPCSETAPPYAGLTHTERYLLDAHGILVLRGAMRAEEVEAALAAVERSIRGESVRCFGSHLGGSIFMS
eukprot:SAG31_NODE_14074_length_828_cov_1.654321_1_plen_157_part_00